MVKHIVVMDQKIQYCNDFSSTHLYLGRGTEERVWDGKCYVQVHWA